MKKEDKKSFFGILGVIFNPIIPAFLGAGMCAGVSGLLAFCPQDSFGYTIHLIFGLVSSALNKYLPALIGISAAQQFGATPIMGGILGLVTVLDQVDVVAQRTGFSAFLHAGSGGAIAVIGGVFLLSLIEKFFHKHFSKGIDQVLSPFISITICLFPYLFLFMPVMGFLTEVLSDVFLFICSNENSVVRVITGYLGAAIFLPAQLMGLQPAFQTIYIIQLETVGLISLFPMLAMAGAGQVGTAIAVSIKSKKEGNKNLSSLASSGILPGILGVGNMLLYGISVPFPKTFLTTCLGAGFGGAYIAMAKVAATGWGSSGILAIPLVTGGDGSPFMNMLNYAIGLFIACVCSFVLTMFFVKSAYLANKSLEEK